MAFPPKHDHKIPLVAAAALTRRYRESAGKGAQLGSMFPREVFESLLAQPGCMGIRAYAGQSEDSARKTVLVGVDGDGNDMTAGALFDADFPCPPYCGDPDVLNG